MARGGFGNDRAAQIVYIKQSGHFCGTTLYRELERVAAPVGTNVLELPSLATCSYTSTPKRGAIFDGPKSGAGPYRDIG
jgi:hypothetical protein